MEYKQPVIGDAFGTALWAKHHGIDASEIIETTTGNIWANHEGMEAYFEPYPRWPAHEKEAISHAHGNVLDIGCGAGRHSLYLQQRRHKVTAIDSSYLATEVARLRGVRDARCLSIENVDELEGGYDTVLLLGLGLGLLQNIQRSQAYLRILHKLTSPSAIIIGESTQSKYFVPEITEKDHGGEKLRCAPVLRIRYLELTTEWFQYCYISLRELKRMIAHTGWKLREKIGGEHGAYAVILAKK